MPSSMTTFFLPSSATMVTPVEEEEELWPLLGPKRKAHSWKVHSPHMPQNFDKRQGGLCRSST